MTYEHVAKDVDGAIRSLASAFDLRLRARPAAVDATRQARSRTAQVWCDRFRDECDDFVDFWTEHRGLITAA